MNTSIKTHLDRHNRKNLMLRALSLPLLVALLLAATRMAGANETVPLKGDIVGTLSLGLPPTADSVGTGTLTGLFTQHLIFSELDLINGFGGGSYVQTAANGDSFFGMFTVTFISAEGDFLGTFTVEGGTGRFAGATGGGPSAGKLNPDLTFSYHYEGSISRLGGK